MKPGDRLLCVLVQSLPVFTEFKDWPLHLTLVPWFRTNVNSKTIAQDLAKEFHDIRPFTVKMAEEHIRFSYQENKLVTLVRLSLKLGLIEQKSREYLHRQNAWIVDESTTKQRYHQNSCVNVI